MPPPFPPGSPVRLTEFVCVSGMRERGSGVGSEAKGGSRDVTWYLFSRAARRKRGGGPEGLRLSGI